MQLPDHPKRQRLDCYRLPDSYSPGAGRVRQALWFCIGSPLLAARWLPGSAWRAWLLRRHGARIGQGCRIKPGLRVKYPWRLEVGHHCWLGEEVWIDNLAPVILGEQVCLSQGAYLCTGNHDYRHSGFDLLLGKIHIGDGAWIGARAVIAPGVNIGSDAVVGLGAVITKTIEPATVVTGSNERSERKRWER